MSKPFFTLVLLLVLAVSRPVQSRTIEGQPYEEQMQLAGSTLLLNGVGLRQVAWFKGYAAGLYLTRKATTTDQALSAPGPTRLQIRMLVDVDTIEFSKSFNRGIRRNTPAAQQAALGERMQAFDQIILGVGKVKTNDAIDIDFLPGRGVVLSVNGKPRGAPVPGDDLYAALLRIFLGDKPADPELKQGLLGAPL